MHRGKLTVRDLRAGNRARVLRALYLDGPRSRHELAEVTGLSQGSVSNVTGELIADGVVVAVDDRVGLQMRRDRLHTFDAGTGVRTPWAG